MIRSTAGSIPLHDLSPRVNPSFLCPIEHAVMFEPITLENGQTLGRPAFEAHVRASVEAHQRSGSREPCVVLCPLTRQPLGHLPIRYAPAYGLQGAIEADPVARAQAQEARQEHIADFGPIERHPTNAFVRLHHVGDIAPERIVRDRDGLEAPRPVHHVLPRPTRASVPTAAFTPRPARPASPVRRTYSDSERLVNNTDIPGCLTGAYICALHELCNDDDDCLPIGPLFGCIGAMLSPVAIPLALAGDVLNTLAFPGKVAYRFFKRM